MKGLEWKHILIDTSKIALIFSTITQQITKNSFQFQIF